jgi:uncharacterized protein (AIM24 family)
MSVIRKTTATALVAAAALSGVATAAEAPVVSPQHWIAGSAPVTIPGTGVQKGEWMGSKSVAVFRTVTLEGRQTVKLTLKAPKGKKIRGLGLAEGSKIGVKANGAYVGRSSVSVTAYLAPSADGEQSARVFALAR